MVDKYKLHFQRLIPLSVQLSLYIELMDQHKTMIQEPIVKKEGKAIVSKLKKAGFRIRIFFWRIRIRTKIFMRIRIRILGVSGGGGWW